MVLIGRVVLSKETVQPAGLKNTHSPIFTAYEPAGNIKDLTRTNIVGDNYMYCNTFCGAPNPFECLQSPSGEHSHLPNDSIQCQRGISLANMRSRSKGLVARSHR